MFTKNQAIVLSKLRYRDNDLIVKSYTKERGVVSYLIRNAFNKKNNRTIAYFQPLSQLILEENYRENQSLHYIKEIKVKFPYSSLHTNVFKSSIAIFIAEILSISLNEEEQNMALYNYIEAALQWLDTEDSYSNFHLLFLLNFSKYLGFYPEPSQTPNTIFNLQTGAFETSIIDKYSISKENNNILNSLLGTNFDGLNQLQLNAKQRRGFLNMLLQYFELHLGYFKKPKSLEVFSQLFNQ